MSDLPANSKKAKEVQKKTEKPERPRAVQGSNPLEGGKDVEKKAPPKQIVTASVKQPKESVFKKFKSNFFGSDVNSVVGYITTEVLLPALKDLIVDTASKGVERMIYGEVRSRRGRGSSDNRSRYSYGNPIDVRPRPTRGVVPPRQHGGRSHMVGEVYLESRIDGEQVLETLSEMIDRYGVASIADLYGLLGHPTNYIDNNWGWTDLRFADVVQTPDGWLLKLPSVQPL